MSRFSKIDYLTTISIKHALNRFVDEEKILIKYQIEFTKIINFKNLKDINELEHEISIRHIYGYPEYPENKTK